MLDRHFFSSWRGIGCCDCGRNPVSRAASTTSRGSEIGRARWGSLGAAISDVPQSVLSTASAVSFEQIANPTRGSPLSFFYQSQYLFPPATREYFRERRGPRYLHARQSLLTKEPMPTTMAPLKTY